ncbi:LamG-like jellyroll fold domain-containing protein [Dyadobacter sp. CY323]|uniref:LamG-like jellyroll fold domain-containing protein n=1 Tax=Dyadobacter sp. CY323 TaxID=2907302 RepID=UPI001F2DE306|nr:LamG-like jellyroll fold domain-containing protein [Dyadobacter sp. CY323]MCE6992724.1 gliding motility-associated C-terminal domain-containing protein [Dyadobacter sp. CY323]
MKHCFTLILLCVFFVSAKVYAQVNLANGLVGCYPFSGDANDFSVLGNHGEVHGARLAPDRFGNANSAYDFDGLDDNIEISPADLQMNAFTYSMWVKPESTPFYNQGLFLFSIGSDYGDQHILFGDHYSLDRHTGFSHGCYLGVANNIACSQPTVPPIDKWYHLVLVRNATDYVLYVDNVMVCSDSHGGQNAFYGTSTVRAMIGARNNYGQAANATIDDIHLYNRPLNREEITALFNGTEEITSTGELISSKLAICAGNPTPFLADSNIPQGTFKWYVDNVVQTGSTSKELMYTTPARGESYRMKVKVEITPEVSCFSQKPLTLEKEVEVKVCSSPEAGDAKLFVPSAFTPNQDGMNDTWNIVNMEQFERLELLVYNRWGEVIFYSENYQIPWNGIYKGSLVSSGIYSYKILSEKKLVKSGSITVLY